MILKDLNLEQKQAVIHKNGPLLIVAGAGTGKTAVITQRIAWLIEQGLAKTDEILALTFTDKAAGEMEERVDKLLPYGYVDLWIMTFHSFCERILKNYALIQNAIGDDGGYGEGYGYYNFSMLSWSKSLPAVKNVFGVDLSAKINRSYEELIWAGVVKDKKTFYFGDSGGDLRPLTNWAWLLPKYKDPLLGWFYNFMKNGETFMDVLYETEDVPKQYPFNKDPDRIFKDIGTTVFKSGWDRDDFVFVMRTGPFINHQHLDQGTFWLYDNGAAFIEERHGSNYYRQLLYQSRYIQPIAHSTILIDKNPQSQRTGDPFDFAKGFEDYAYHTHYLDGKNAAFSSGELGRLYWNKVKQRSEERRVGKECRSRWSPYH